MDAEIKKTVPDGTTASFVMLKRARNGADRPARTRARAPGATHPFARGAVLTPGDATDAPGLLCAGAIGVKVAWVGDSRAVLARYTDGGKTEVTPLTRDHKVRTTDGACCNPLAAAHAPHPCSRAHRQASDVMEAARIEAFYAALHRRGSNRSDSDEGSVRRRPPRGVRGAAGRASCAGGADVACGRAPRRR